MKLAENWEIVIKNYFLKRKIRVKDFYITCAEDLEEYRVYNKAAAEMIMKITKESDESVVGLDPIAIPV